MLDPYQPRQSYFLIDELRVAAQGQLPDRNLSTALFRLEASRKRATPPRIAPARGPPLWEEDDCVTIFLDEERFAHDPLAQPKPDYEFDQRVSW